MLTKALAAVVVLLLLTACVSQPLSPAPSSSPSVDLDADVVDIVGEPEVLATDLEVPWSIVPLGDGSTLISERNSALIKEVTADGEVRVVGQIAGVVPRDEGGLLGLAVLDGEWLYAYYTAETDNRIARFALTGEAGAYAIGEPELVFSGIVKARSHNGGRIKFGPDGMLYVTTGDATEVELSQDLASVSGKILRMTPTGAVPGDNPFAGSYVYSFGHRNPQGLAWDDEGQLWASEFGQETWDELNRIVPGGNYGWPLVEGIAGDGQYIDPVLQWHTFDSSPSGLVYIQGTFFMAALRGERIWALHPSDESVDDEPWFVEEYGRIRDVEAGPNGTLWFITSNTDGRGELREADDKLYQVQLEGVK